MDSTPSYSAHLRALADPALLAERRDMWDMLYDAIATPAQRRIAAKRLRLIAAERRRRANSTTQDGLGALQCGRKEREAMKCTVTRRYTIAAAHRLAHHAGKCARQHGHNYELTVAVRGLIRAVAPGTATGPSVMATDERSIVGAHDSARDAWWRAQAAERLTTGIPPTARGAYEPPADAFRSDVGMVIDFADLDAIVEREIMAKLDHQDLSVVLPDVYTTAENLAAWMWYQLAGQIVSHTDGGAGLAWLRLDETPKSSVFYTADDWLTA